MVCEIVKKIENSGVKVANLVGDEDTTSIARLRKEIAHPINKRSDMNHLKKALGNSLYELRKKHKSLSPMVISYFQKLYSYCIRQNQDSVEKLTSGLNNIVSHAFGIHENCDELWCGYKRNPETFKFSSLPYGKPLSGDDMKKDLEALFTKQSSRADKLSHIGSTQANESLNMSIASKAPKNKHFSESCSLQNRIKAGVAQKNMGYGYVSSVSFITFSAK